MALSSHSSILACTSREPNDTKSVTRLVTAQSSHSSRVRFGCRPIFRTALSSDASVLTEIDHGYLEPFTTDLGHIPPQSRLVDVLEGASRPGISWLACNCSNRSSAAIVTTPSAACRRAFSSANICIAICTLRLPSCAASSASRALRCVFSASCLAMSASRFAALRAVSSKKSVTSLHEAVTTSFSPSRHRGSYASPNAGLSPRVAPFSLRTALCRLLI